MTVTGSELGWTTQALELFSLVCCFPISALFFRIVSRFSIPLHKAGEYPLLHPRGFNLVGVNKGLRDAHVKGAQEEQSCINKPVAMAALCFLIPYLLKLPCRNLSKLI